jgi:hypothetical protein
MSTNGSPTSESVTNESVTNGSATNESVTNGSATNGSNGHGEQVPPTDWQDVLDRLEQVGADGTRYSINVVSERDTP